MKNILKHTIKIPNDVRLIYVSKKKVIILISSTHKKLLKLNVQIFVNKQKKIIISQLPFKSIPNNINKNLKAYQGTCVSLIKQNIIGVSILLYQKLKFVGVGYRVSTINEFKNQLLLFKLGYSHFLYFKIPKNFKIFNSKMIKLFLFCNSYQHVTQLSSLIRFYKKPEPYKGKGILYDNEKITLKKRKKI